MQVYLPSYYRVTQHVESQNELELGVHAYLHASNPRPQKNGGVRWSGMGLGWVGEWGYSTVKYFTHYVAKTK